MPFGPYSDFADCVQKNTGKMDDPKAFCAWLRRRIEGGWFEALLGINLLNKEKAEEALKNPVEVWKNDPDAVVVDDHRWVHVWERGLQSGHELFITRQQLRRLHDIIVDELARRRLDSGLNHKSPMKAQVVELGSAMEILLKNRRPFLLDPTFISIVGSTVSGVAKPNDLDVMMATVRNHAYGSRFLSSIPENLRKSVEVIFEPSGPNGPYVPSYELWAVPVKTLAVLEPKYRIQPMSPLPPAAPRETIEDPRDLLEDSYFVVPVKGVRLMLHRKENQVIAFDRDLDEASLPSEVTKDLLKIEPRTFILDGFLTRQKDKPIFYMFDMPWWRDSEHTRQTAEERRVFLQKIPQTDHLKIAPTRYFSNRRDTISYLEDVSGPCLLIPGDTTYPIDGNADWYSYGRGASKLNLEEGADAKIRSLVDADKWESMPGDERFSLMAKRQNIEVLYPFAQLKTIKKGYAAHEVFGIKSVGKLAEELFKVPTKQAVEVKVDGFRSQLHKKGDQVRIFTESGHDYTAQVPHLAEAVKKVVAKDVVLDAECTPYGADFVNLGRQGAVNAFTKGAKVPVDDSLWAMHVFDVLYIDGEDLHKLPYEERRKKLHGLELPVRDVPKSKDDFRMPLWENNVYWATSADQMIKLADQVSKVPGSEGAMFKDAESAYRLSGKTPLWSKMKVSYEIDSLVVGILKPEKLAEGTVNYIGAIGPVKGVTEGDAAPLDSAKDKKFVKWKGKTYSVLGKTFNTELKADIGGIIRVSVKWISKIEDQVYHWFQPKVVEVREDKFHPDPLEVAETIFKTSQTVSKVPGPKPTAEMAFLIGARLYEASPIVCCMAPWVAIKREGGFDYLQNTPELYSELYNLGIDTVIGSSIDRDLLERYFEAGIRFESTSATTIEEYLEGTEYVDVPDIEEATVNVKELKAFQASLDSPPMIFMKLSCGALIPLERPPLKLQDPYQVYPDEKKKWRYAIQFHIRGLSVHADPRMTTGFGEGAIGWTWDNPKSLIRPMLRRTSRELRAKAGITEQDMKLPIHDLSEKLESTAEGKKLAQMLSHKVETLPFATIKQMCEELWKEELQPVLEDPNSKIYTQSKGEMTPSWLDYEREVPAGETGATAELQGIFVIMDKGAIEFGAQKSYYHEYFVKGKRLNGRIVVRRIPTRKEWGVKESFAWMTFFTKKGQMPYVISSRGVEKGWMPPKGTSALPGDVRSQIPDQYRYWVADNPKEIRDELVKAIKHKDVPLKLAAGLRFTVKRVWHKGAEVQRGLPVVRHWILLYNGPRVVKAFNFGTEADPTEEDGLTARQWDTRGLDDLLATTGDLPADHPASETKKLENHFDTSDDGSAKVLEDSNSVIRLDLHGKILKGRHAFVREDPNSDSWIFQKTELSSEKKAMFMASPACTLRLGIRDEDLEVQKIGDLLLIRGPAIKPGEVLPMDGEPSFFTKEGIQKFWPSMYRQPVVVFHGDLKGDVIGFVARNWFDEKTGWGWAEAVIWHPVGIKLILDRKLSSFSIEVLPEKVWDPEHQHSHVTGGTCMGLSVVPKGACATCNPVEARTAEIKVVPGKVYKFGMTLAQYLMSEHWVKGRSTQSLADEVGRPRSTIENWMERSGIPRRDQADGSKLRFAHEADAKIFGGKPTIIALGTGAFSDIPRDKCPQCEEARSGGPSRRNYTATLFSIGNDRLLVNAPRGIGEMLSSRQVKPTYVIIEHIHEDVVGGLNELRGTKPVVFMTRDAWNYLRQHHRALSKEKGDFEDIYNFKRYVMEPGKAFKAGPFTVEPVKVEHAKPGDPAALGFKIKMGDKVIWHCSDVLDIPNKKKILDNVDIFIGDGASMTRGIRQGEDGFGHTSIEEQVKWAQEANIPRIYFTQIGHVGKTHEDLNKALQELTPKAHALKDGEEIALGSSVPAAVHSRDEATALLEGRAKVIVRSKPHSEYAMQAIYFTSEDDLVGLYVEGFPEGPLPVDKAKQMEHGLSDQEWKKRFGRASQVWIYRPRILRRYEQPKKINNFDAGVVYIHNVKIET